METFVKLFLILGGAPLLVSGRISFVKDQSITKIEFPPRTYQTYDSGIPNGHLRPLGWQRLPESRVAEEKTMLTPLEFFSRFVEQGKPVVFRNALHNVPAMQNWQSDDYLKKHYGDINIHVVVKKEIFKSGPKRLKLKRFLKEYHSEDWYLSNTIPEEMMHELVLPKCLKCGMSQYLQESEIWMSSGGTSSLLHSHADHNLHCLLAGRKDFILINSIHKNRLAYRSKGAHPAAGHSEMDTERINMFYHPHIAEIPWSWSTLQPGDCIYVPAAYLHQVRSYGRSFSSTMLWAPSPEYDFRDCNHTSLDDNMPLDALPFIWRYKNADKKLSNTKLNPHSLRNHLLVQMRDEDGLRIAQFAEFYKEALSETRDRSQVDVDVVWKMMVPSGRRTLYRDQVKRMNYATLEKISRLLNEPSAYRREEL